MCEVDVATYTGLAAIERMKTHWIRLLDAGTKKIVTYALREKGLYVQFVDEEKPMKSIKTLNFFFENTFVDYEPLKKAYHVWDKDGEGEDASHQIVFAETSLEAIEKSDAYGMSGYMEDMGVKRQPHFDRFSDTQKVPMKEMVKHGWRYECLWCNGFTEGSDGEVVGESIICDTCIAEAEKEVKESTDVL